MADAFSAFARLSKPQQKVVAKTVPKAKSSVKKTTPVTTGASGDAMSAFGRLSPAQQAVVNATVASNPQAYGSPAPAPAPAPLVNSAPAQSAPAPPPPAPSVFEAAAAANPPPAVVQPPSVATGTNAGTGNVAGEAFNTIGKGTGTFGQELRRRQARGPLTGLSMTPEMLRRAAAQRIG